MSVETQQFGSARRVDVRGAATVYQSSEVARALGRAFVEADEVELDLGAAAEVDSAFLQLLVAATHAASASRKPFTVRHGEASRALASRLGIVLPEAAILTRQAA